MDDATKNMIANLESKTGKTFSEWLLIAKGSGAAKHGELVKYLKSDHGLTHGYANLVAHKSRETDAASVSESVDLVDSQYSGKESLRPIYDKLIKSIEKFGNDIELSPKKAYVSLRRNKQFGIIQPSTKTRLDVGINIKGKVEEGKLEKSGSFNSMVSHRVRLSSVEDVNSELIGWLREAYNLA